MNTSPATITQQPPLRCPSHAVSRARQEKRDRQQQVMATGPHLDADGHALIVPSEWYNQAAATFWRQHGFQFDKPAATWKRDTRLPLVGKCYTADAWLESTRRQFYQFWPDLLHNCERCGKQFARINRYQSLCDNCTRLRQEAHDRHFSYQ